MSMSYPYLILPNIYRMMAAVATGSIDQCKATADQIIAEATVIQAQQQQDAQQQQPQEGQQAPPAN